MLGYTLGHHPERGLIVTSRSHRSRSGSHNGFAGDRGPFRQHGVAAAATTGSLVTADCSGRGVAARENPTSGWYVETTRNPLRHRFLPSYSDECLTTKILTAETGTNSKTHPNGDRRGIFLPTPSERKKSVPTFMTSRYLFVAVRPPPLPPGTHHPPSPLDPNFRWARNVGANPVRSSILSTHTWVILLELRFPGVGPGRRMSSSAYQTKTRSTFCVECETEQVRPRIRVSTHRAWRACTRHRIPSGGPSYLQHRGTLPRLASPRLFPSPHEDPSALALAVTHAHHPLRPPILLLSQAKLRHSSSPRTLPRCEGPSSGKTPFLVLSPASRALSVSRDLSLSRALSLGRVCRCRRTASDHTTVTSSSPLDPRRPRLTSSI